MSLPLVSVLLPVRNGASWLGEALASIQGQTLADFELIVVDDGSTDASAAIAAEHARSDPRIRLVRGPAEGISAALNAGLACCRAPFIARMDADDIALPQRLERQLAAIEQDPGLGAVGCQVEIFPREGMSENLLAYEAWLNSLTSPERIERECLVESPLVHPAAFIRAEALREVGGWRTRGWPEDYDLWLALLRRGWRLDNVPEVLLRWRDGSHRLTRTRPDYSIRAMLRLKAYHLARQLGRGAPCILWGAGKTGRIVSRALRDEGVSIAQVVEIDPRRIGSTLHGAPIVSPDALGGFEGHHLVAAVGAKGARALIRGFLQTRGWIEREHFTCLG